MRCLRMAPFVLLVATLALAFGVASEDSSVAGDRAIPALATGSCSATCSPCPGDAKTPAVDADFDHPNPAVVPHAIVY